MRRRLAGAAALGRDLAATLAGRRRPIFLDYVHPIAPRYGHGQPPHDGLERLIAAGRETYRDVLGDIAGHADRLGRIPLRPATPGSGPAWQNRWFSGLDAAALYGLVATRRPARYVEIGSGHSTMFARRAIADLNLSTTITSIDPQPRAGIDELADEVVRRGLERVDLSIFDGVGPGDVVFMDGSHRVFTNSDATVFFLDVLPRLQEGVLIQVHDVYLPDDYPPAWNRRYYSEQYLLAVALLAAPARFRPILPVHHVAGDPELAAILDPVWEQVRLPRSRRGGGSFWLELGPTEARSGG